MNELATAKAAVLSLNTVPYQKRWVDKLQGMELKREVAGTSRIEGAEFSTRELDRAIEEETPDELFTRSQRQARAALTTYEWIKKQPVGLPITTELILNIHRLVVTDADDDHCTPGVLRGDGHNVTFGTPAHRGIEGGEQCAMAFAGLVNAIETEFRAHDPLVQAIATHYHIAAMHPFGDGNGRTARALEAFMLRRAGLRDTTFIAMSNYYYDEKPSYLATLAAVREQQGDLTPFLKFALRGVDLQARRLLREIQTEIKRELFRTLAMDLFERLQSPRKRVIAKRQMEILNLLLPIDSMSYEEFIKATETIYRRDKLQSGAKARLRDVLGLHEIQALRLYRTQKDPDDVRLGVDLDWPSKITESAFFEAVKTMPKATTLSSIVRDEKTPTSG